MLDPIRELVQAMETSGKPPLPWVIRWSEGAIDPVLAAWRRSWSADDMVRLLEFVKHPALPMARRAALAPILWTSSDADRVRCEAIRRHVPQPPTLDEVLAAADRSLLRFAQPVALSA